MAEFDDKKFAEHQAALKGSSSMEGSGGSAKKEKKKRRKKKKEKQQQEEEKAHGQQEEVKAHGQQEQEADNADNAAESAEEMHATELILAAEPKSKDPFEKKKRKKKKKNKEKQQQEEEEEAHGQQEEGDNDAESAEEMDAAEWILSKEPKWKDPFNALPEGTFNMDEFKRCYCNEEKTVSIPFFWEKFDAENYSIWLGEYKYNDELQKVWMSCNLISVMYQRLDMMRKNAFASMCLFGNDNNSSISGILVCRGQGLAFELAPDWTMEYESYRWTKLDPTKEETKKLVQQYLSWTGTDKQGRKFNQGKIFK